jgi:hypothetical protein
MSSSRSYSWMPDWLRKFLNLDDELPNYGSGGGGAYSAPQYDTPPPARPQASYTPPQAASAVYTPAPPTWTPTRLEDSSTGSYRMVGPTGEATGMQFSAPPAPAMRASTPAGDAGPAGAGAPVGVPPSGEGYVQPVGYMFRTYARGALPPQGLEQFTREFRATLTDVWNFYSYWTRFQTDEVVRIGREAMDTVVDNLPSSEGSAPASTSGPARRIKINTANGNGEKKVVEAAPPPAPVVAPQPPAAVDPPAGPDDEPKRAS